MVEPTDPMRKETTTEKKASPKVPKTEKVGTSIEGTHDVKQMAEPTDPMKAQMRAKKKGFPKRLKRWHIGQPVGGRIRWRVAWVS